LGESTGIRQSGVFVSFLHEPTVADLISFPPRIFGT
jgi:hypothetical protein